MITDIPEQLHKAFQNKTLIPIVGAGVSMSLLDKEGNRIFPSWKELLERAANKLLEEKKPDLANAILGVLPVGDYQKAADYARRGLTGSLWDQFFKTNFAIKKQTIEENSFKLPKAIWDLSSRIITLNYDRVLRFACPTPDDLLELDNTKKNALADFKRDTLNAPAIWHLHGSLDNLDKIIFTSESYNNLYLNQDLDYRTAIETFRSICGNSNMLFVGCGLDDAELLTELEREHKLFSGNVGPHYALVPARDYKQIQEKLKEIDIELVSFADFGEPLLQQITSITSPTPARAGSPDAALSAEFTNLKKSIHSPAQKAIKKAAILVANPIGENPKHTEILPELRSLKLETVQLPLNIHTLNELEGFNYIFIVSNVVKKKIVIENEFLLATGIGLKDLEDNIGNSGTEAVFLLLSHNEFENFDEAEISSLKLPTIILPNAGKQGLASLSYKIFKKKEYEYISGAIVANRHSIKVTELSGKPKPEKPRTSLPDLIDPKSTQNYVGRRLDLENICRSIIEIQNKNKFLTIKGSGGIGKTITVKKIAVALAERNLFGEGIDFIDCEFIKDYSTFEKKVAINFGLENALNIKKQIKENEHKSKRLIILDNVEPLLYLSDHQEIKDFIYFICDYATIVITSRELLKLECEQVYELRAFTTDEAFDLFARQIHPRTITPNEERFVRENLLETLLANNPLAIKLVANNIPNGKNFFDLKRDLEENFFKKLNDSELNDFEKVSDSNIERRKSLYASIHFSYSNLSENEKMAFELLSLFPNGIDMENLKRIAENRKAELRSARKKRSVSASSEGAIITDTVIKSLEDKSMTQVDKNIIKLQSIVGRFAEYQLNKRSENQLAHHYRNATNYNISLARYLDEVSINDEPQACKIFSLLQGNFFKSIAYIKKSGFDDFILLRYLNDIGSLAIPSASCNVYAAAMISQREMFSDPISQQCYDAILCFTEYHAGQFEKAASKLSEIIQIDSIKGPTVSTPIEKITAANALSLYRLEGYEVADIKYQMELRPRLRAGFYPSSLFKIGIVNKDLLKVSNTDFFTLDAKYSIGELNISEINEYLASLFEKDHLGLMEAHYLRAKMGIVDKAVVKKLAHVNPFTRGLQQIIYAIGEGEAIKKNTFFEQALDNLRHIKYYYVEAMLLYARHLKQIDSDLFLSVVKKGHALSVHHQYQWLRYNFEDLLEKKSEPYHIKDYPLDESLDIDGYVKFLIKEYAGRRPIKHWTT